MAYTQTLIDNFDDNVIDTGKWTVVVSSGLTEVGQKLRFSANSAYPTVNGQTTFDISTGILAAKMIATGSGGAETEFEFGVRDTSGNAVKLFATPVNGDINFSVSGSASHSDMVVTDVAGVGGGWVSNSWIGVGNLGSDNIIHVYKSTDGITWAEMARTTVSGTFNKTAVGFFVSIGKWGGTTAWTYEFDDASYFLEETSSVTKVRVAGAWVSAAPKVRVAGAWVSSTPKARVSGTWITT